MRLALDKDRWLSGTEIKLSVLLLSSHADWY
jgi:hypothetical protein